MYQLRESGLVTLYVKKATNVYFFYLNEKKKEKGAIMEFLQNSRIFGVRYFSTETK